jgi:hypothetical protein
VERVPPTSKQLGPANAVPFQAHVELLQFFLAHRDEIVERIQALLNVQRKPVQYLRNRRLLSRHFEDGFFTLAGVTNHQARLRGQLEQAHWASGFKPREIPGMHNDLVDPAEMMRRAFHLWAQTRWPGRNGRVHYARTLFNLYLTRHLALLSMRVWDAGGGSAGERLAQAQGVLDRLWSSTPADQPVFVRDARWLIPVAQSPATDELSPYFDVAERISATFSEDDRIEILKAVVRMAAGHLRSYLHYYITQKGVPLDDSRLVLITRRSNALDYSLLIHGLVPLLEAYERATHGGDEQTRLELADAICQGVSADPDLFINRADSLGAYSMVEHLFTTTVFETTPLTTEGDGHAAYTSLGQRHVRLLQEYEARIARLAKPLSDDCRHFRPVDGAYSPLGVIFGFSSNLLEHMALKSVQSDAVTRFGLEDVFSAGDADKLAWVNGWRKLPHVDPEVARLYAYPQKFAEAIFERVERALSGHASVHEGNAVAQTGRLFIPPGDDSVADSKAASIPDLPMRYIRSSDAQIVAAQKAEACDPTQLLNERLEGHFVLSYETPGGWVGITKDFLTEVLGTGRDAKIVGLPGVAAERLRLMCRDLVSK